MKTHLVRLAAVVLLAQFTRAASDTFCLRTESGHEIGPIEFRDGAKLQVGDQTLTIAKVLTPTQRMQDRLRAIVIPTLDLKDANLATVIQYLEAASREFDTSAIPVDRKGITFVYCPQFDGATVVPGNPTNHAVLSTNAPATTISMSFRNLSLKSALGSFLPLMGLKHLVRDEVVLIVDLSAPETPLITRRYEVLPSVQERTNSHPDGSSGHETELSEWKDFLKQQGMTWPLGSSIRYEGVRGDLVVCNTETNLAVLEGVLDELTVFPSQIEIELQLVAFQRDDISRIGTSGLVDVDALLKLRAEGRSELLAAPKVVTKSGSEAMMRAVTEVIYPTAFSVYQPGGTNTNSTVAIVGTVVEPGAFETRETGIILTVLPEVSSSGSDVNLRMSPEYVSDPVWRDYGAEYVDSNGKTQKAKMEQPFFFAIGFSTTVQVKKGQTVLVSGGMETRDKAKMVYAFVTARLIGTDGRPLPQPGKPAETTKP